HRLAETRQALDRRAETRWTRDITDALVTQRYQVVRHLGNRESVVGDHDARRVVEHGVGDAHIGTVGGVQRARQFVVLGYRRQQDGAAQLLALDEAAHAGDEVWFHAIAGMHDVFVFRVADGVERAFHEVDDVLRIRVVVDEADEKRLAKGEP